MPNAVWVFAENKAGEYIDSSLELICEGKRLAGKLQEKLCAILIGHRVESLAETLAQYGVDTTYTVEQPGLETYHPERFTNIIAGLAGTYDPGMLLYSATTMAQDLAPRVAARLRTNLIPNCDRLEISGEGIFLQTRLTHQNKLHTTLASPHTRPQMATFEPGVGKIKKVAPSQEMERIQVDPRDYIEPEACAIKITRFIKADPRTIDISDAELIVSGGKGVGEEAHFQLIHDLADALGASVAGSRVAVDNQWIGRERQIGQSGQTVSPDLMISCGISGATAHTFGMRDTKTLIAINKEKAAPMMKLADLGVVGDLHGVLPVLIKRLKEIKKQSNTV